MTEPSSIARLGPAMPAVARRPRRGVASATLITLNDWGGVRVTEPPSDSPSDPRVATPNDERLSDRYRQLRARLSETDLESLSDLLVSAGLEILDRDVPYVLVALRNRTRDRIRREQRGQELAATSSAVAGPLDAADPAAIVASRSELEAVVSAMDQLEERDRWLLWWHAAGLSDDEIRLRWEAAGFTPPTPSRAMLRQRRARARDRLRQASGHDSQRSDDPVEG